MIQDNTPAKVGLLELLLASSGVQFVIPAYQRNYTWTSNREVKQLLDDITAMLRDLSYSFCNDEMLLRAFIAVIIIGNYHLFHDLIAL